MMHAPLTLRTALLLGLLSLTTACLATEKPRMPMNTDDNPVTTHHIGRFMIQVPQSMKVAHRSARLRHRELEEIIWMSNAKAAVEATWKARLAEIEKKQPPKGRQTALIEVRDLGNEIRAVLYYGDADDDERTFCDLLVAENNTGVWIKSVGVQTKVEKMMEQNIDIARAYRPIYPATLLPKENAFFLEHGFIELPYRSQERTYSRFEGHPLNVKLEIETNEIHKDEPQDEGLLGRLSAVLATGFASGVDIKKIRTGKREVGGLKGEETVLRAKTETKTNLSFMWRYAGKKDSGDHPEIIIEIDARDGNLDEKLKLWDTILNSFKPVGP